MKKEDITIDIHQEHLTISGETKSTSESEIESISGAYTVRERKFGKFTRSVKLPKGTKVSRLLDMFDYEGKVLTSDTGRRCEG
jgi:HSP20 family protein